MRTISTYRGRFVQYSTTSFTYSDPGKTDYAGDPSWTRFKGFGPVAVFDSNKQQVGPTIEGAYTHIYGYRITFSSYLGAEQVVLLGDFILVNCSGWAIMNSGTRLLFNEDTIEHYNIWDVDTTDVVEVDVGLNPPLDLEEYVNQTTEHISPVWNGEIPTDAILQEWTEEEYVQFYEQHPKLHTCGGALRVSFTPKGKRSQTRWLFPHPEGTRAAWNEMLKTTLEDDWFRLMGMIDNAHPIERERILKSFAT